jgi:hypothetical protein
LIFKKRGGRGSRGSIEFGKSAAKLVTPVKKCRDLL